MNASRRRQIRERAEATAKYGTTFSPRLALELLDRLDRLEEVAEAARREEECAPELRREAKVRKLAALARLEGDAE